MNPRLDNTESTKAMNINCEVCGKIFKRRDYKKIHFDTAHSGKRFTCNICNVQITQATNLKLHIEAVHKGIRHHKCDSCSVSFSQAI